MRNQYETILKHFFFEHQTKTRAELQWTQAKMAERLCMELRSYSDLDQCKSSYSGLTLACYLIYCCEDPMAFLSGLYEAFKPLTDAKPRNVQLESHGENLSQRSTLQVTEILETADGECFPVCPRCKITLEREYMGFCDRCGQKLNWHGFPKSATVYIVHKRDPIGGSKD